jgi:hypothetical protein
VSLHVSVPLLRGWLLSAIHSLSLPMILYASGPSPTASRELKERVDLIELNHFFDDLGRHAYDQVIFYEWSPDYGRFHVIAWSLVENDLYRMPTRLPGSGDYVVHWYDRDARVKREIRSPLYRETWSQVDPERANKKLIDEKYRACLLRQPSRNLN